MSLFDLLNNPYETMYSNLDTTIKNTFTAMKGRLRSIIKKGERNEEETRLWVRDFLKDALGYTNEDIETEFKVLGKRVDIVLKEQDKVLLVIEIKSATERLNSASKNQSVNYATSLHCEWTLVCNGHIWQLYHIKPNIGSAPEVVKVFEISLFDDDGLSLKDIRNLGYLTKSSICKGKTLKLYHTDQCLTDLKNFLYSDESLSFIKAKMVEKYKEPVNIDDEDLIKKLNDIIIK